MIPGFPHEAIPDGTVWVPHHYIYLVAAAAFVTLTVWDDYRGREPFLTMAGFLVGLFGFLFMWPTRGYHELGALTALVAPTISLATLVNPRGGWARSVANGGYPTHTRAAAAILAALGLDDAIEHAFGIPTPLDTGFDVLGVWGSALVVVLVLALVAVEYRTWERFGSSPPKS